MAGILYALLPAVAWGSLVFVSVKLGGNAYSQTIGITAGAFLFSIVIYFIKSPDLTLSVLLIGFISGVLWSIGQLYQLASAQNVGVSKAVPISTGMQLVGTTLFGVFVFHEWDTAAAITIGSCSILLIISGVLLTSFGQQGDSQKGELKKGIFTLLLSTAGFVGYVIILKWFNIGGWEAVLPQSIGMAGGAFLLSMRHKPFTTYALKNILTGVMWAIGNLGLLLAIPRIGVAISFSMSQMGIVISTFGGIFLLGEKKSKRQLIFVVIGSVLVIAGGVLLGVTKK
ncbi:GRP family sugar transporter [Peribacillus deserti]|uniref:Glucose transporter GlcU n=1 Tax=Peribacillus deserti TaxID=673318 RepID=A0A2N5M2C5_9BACI|nr:GRP family sugar transporter [Peribacillus deserti]PLT28517.1 glucose transporter GlcU [Peribacillus deserti]